MSAIFISAETLPTVQGLFGPGCCIGTNDWELFHVCFEVRGWGGCAQQRAAPAHVVGSTVWGGFT